MKTKPFHKFKKGGYFILLDICGGGVHVVDEQIYNALELSENSENDNYKQTAEYAELLEAGLFKDEDNYSEYADLNVGAPLKAMCLHVSHDCNLRCGYCFAEDVIEDKSIMSRETAEKAVDFLIGGSKDREHLEIDFFGGEPLLAWDAVKHTVQYAKKQGGKHKKQFKFTITTNGLLLGGEKTAFINEEIHNVVLSLDGRRETNDRLRKLADGGGSYDVVLPKFRKLIDARIKEGYTDYFIRGTFTAFNTDFADDVVKIAEEGFKNISVEPVTASPDMPFALTENNLNQIKAEYDRLFEIILTQKPDWNFFHFKIDLHDAPCILKRLRGCGAGNEYIAVDPAGNISPCHRYVGLGEWNMGNIKGGKPMNEAVKAYFAKTHIYAKEKCRACWARFYCGGGCNAEFYVFEGDANKPSETFCELMKKRTECAIALAVEREYLKWTIS